MDKLYRRKEDLEFFVNRIRKKLGLSKSSTITSPEISVEGVVTFRFFAPNAKRVRLQGDWLPARNWDFDTVEMEKGSSGVWTYTKKGLQSGLYCYRFVVDGIKIKDPCNLFYLRDVFSVFSAFIVRGGDGDYYSVNDVPHGNVSRVWYKSDSLGMNRRVVVYTPPGYEESRDAFPVLYLLHGSGSDEEAWPALGRVPQIIDNLIARNECEPMIVVMPNCDARHGAAPTEAFPNYLPDLKSDYLKGVFEENFFEIINFINQNYRTIKDRSARAIAGLSSGGFQCLHISKYHPDMFGSIGLFSSGIFPDDTVTSLVYMDMDEKLKVQFDSKPNLYWIATGKNDVLYKENLRYKRYLELKGYEFSFYEDKGGHLWEDWRRYFMKFATLVFR